MSASQKPLTPAVLHILLALSAGERHGYGIMKQVELDSGGRMTMGPGTLYGSIRRMLEDGLIAEAGTRSDPTLDDARRVYYRMTAAGQRALALELERLRVILAATERLSLQGGALHGA